MTEPPRAPLSAEPAPAPASHELKVWPRYFEALDAGAKSFEYRRDDREPRFAVGDVLRLREYEHGYSGRECTRLVTYIARGGLIPDGWCVMSVVPPREVLRASAAPLSEGDVGRLTILLGGLVSEYSYDYERSRLFRVLALALPGLVAGQSRAQGLYNTLVEIHTATKHTDQQYVAMIAAEALNAFDRSRPREEMAPDPSAP